MDMVIGIFQQLGVDASVFPIFAVIVIMFFILKPLFFNKLQFVLELREEKTTKLSGDASETLKKAQELSDTYRDKISEAHVQAQSNFSKKKSTILQQEKLKYKTVEERVNKHIDEKRIEFTKEVELKKLVALKEVDVLADNLVDKLTN